MGVRKLWLMVVVPLCGIVCVFATVPTIAYAFGSYGLGAGEFRVPWGVALDPVDGDVYVADRGNQRIDKFDASGDFLFAWGDHVNAENPTQELQTCTSTTECENGSGGEPFGVTVDHDPLSPSYGDVYVTVPDRNLIEKYDPEGKFLLTLGGEVNETKDNTPGASEEEKNVCLTGEKCTFGREGSGDGQFKWYYRPQGIAAVGPGGDLYVGDKARVEVFESSGAWLENIPLTSLSTEGRVSSLAVNSAGDVFVSIEGVPGVHEFEPNGVEVPRKLDEGSEAVESLTVDGSNDLFVADATDGFHLLEYGTSGEELESFGRNTAESGRGIVFSDALRKLYVADAGNTNTNVWIMTPPPPGPLIEPVSESAAVGLDGMVTLEASINPEGGATAYHFEYVDQARYQVSGYANATSTAPTSTGSGFDDELVSTAVTHLAPGVYHYRIVATNAQGTTTGPDQTISTALIEGPAVSDAASTSATFEARIDPLGTSTEYRLEYGTSTSYGQTLSGKAEGSGYVPVSSHVQNLEPATEYHYRLVISNEFGTYEGVDHAFITQAVGGALTLPDGREWELVSPADKKGAVIEPDPIGNVVDIQSAGGGGGITYVTVGPHVGENPHGKVTWQQVLSRRGSSGWASEDLTLPFSLSALSEGSELTDLTLVEPEYHLFSPDLSSAVVEPQRYGTPPLSPEATERTPYIRNDVTGTFMPLVTPSNVPSGTKFGGEEPEFQIRILAATPDLSNVVLGSALALTPGAATKGHEWNLYEWTKGQLQLINILPNGEQVTGTSGSLAPELAGQIRAEEEPFSSASRAVSNDGRWIAWTWGNPYIARQEEHYRGSSNGLYVSDMVDGKTVRVGGPRAFFQTMSANGSRIFYIERGDLYEFNSNTDTQTDLTGAREAGEHGAGVQEVILGASEDGSYVYFVATGVLASGAVGGEDNLYVGHDGGGGWTTTYIATLSSKDEPSWYTNGTYTAPRLTKMASRVSPDGRYVAFMSNRSLTGYDNTDAISHQPDEEVYLYDASTMRLVCASCNPSGARPVGVYDAQNQQPLVDRLGAWAGQGIGGGGSGPHWLAGNIPGWYGALNATYQSRYLSNNGRLFFNSPDLLVPQATNGLENVYEYEPAGVGSCTNAGATFSPRSGGCVSLLTLGTSSAESVFYDASENGDDVFFLTASKLTAADYDSSFDVYDAHVCTVTVPCASVPSVPPPCTSGDSCKAAPSPQPEIFGPAPSATFSGTGNVVESTKPVARRKSLTSAQRLARALRACRAKRKRTRTVCEGRARKRYGAKQSHGARATRKGHR